MVFLGLETPKAGVAMSDRRAMRSQELDGDEARQRFISAMRGAATGISVITTSGSMGRWAVTVSAVASVSADPPMVLACINRRSPVADAVRAHGIFTMNLLSSKQSHVADVFAGRSSRHAPFDFACADWVEAAEGSLHLAGAAASFHCTVGHVLDAGSHTVLIGKVQNAVAGSASPLVYAGQAYALAQALSPSM
jgi:flavin reductase (DIM6/NTAB) family NADH-FMN oxidoreductase RutF